MSNAPADLITDFETLYAREVEFMTYNVLSLDEEGNTAYVCDVRDLTCSCPDDKYNKSGARVCKHLAAALYTAQETPSVERHYMERLSNDVQTLRASVNDVKQSTTSLQAEATASTQTAAQGASEEEGDGGGDSPLEAFEQTLTDADLDPDKFEYWIDEQYGSLQVEKDGYLDDGEFATWQELSDDLGLKWDNNNELNYLQEQDFGVLVS